MKRHVFAGFLVLVGLLSPHGASSSEKTPPMRMAAFDYPPFYATSEGGIEGIAVDLVHEIFRRLDGEFSLTLYPLKRALRLLENGTADGIMILIKTPERSRYLRFTDPVVTARGLLWYSPERQTAPLKIDSLEDLKGYRIGVTRGYSYGPAFDAMLGRADTVETANSDLQNYRKLLYGRIDIFPGNEIVAHGIFNRHPELAGKFQHTENAFIHWDLRMAVSQKSPAVSLIPRLNGMIRTLKKEGFVDRVVARHVK